ncbi:MAG: AsmA-like C-terminal region-containing protein, partial [Geminicoccaceae bacterium]
LSAEMTLELRRGQPFAAIAIDLDRIEAAELAAWLGVKSGIRGPLDLDVEATSVGRTPYEMMAGLAGDVQIKAGPGEIEGLGIPAFRNLLTSQADDGARVDRSLTMPFREMDLQSSLSRGILAVEDGRLMLGAPAGNDASGEKNGDDQMGDDLAAAIDGTLDLLLWVVDLTLTADGSDVSASAADPAPIYRVIGRPDRPAGFIAAEN